jgi:predicted phosphodiesterase
LLKSHHFIDKSSRLWHMCAAERQTKRGRWLLFRYKKQQKQPGWGLTATRLYGEGLDEIADDMFGLRERQERPYELTMDASAAANSAREVVLVHSSDVHVDDSRGAAGLNAVLGTARSLGADVVLLAGDTFENNQLIAAVLDRTGRLLADCGTQVVILPGNHDPALPDSVFIRGGFDRIGNVHILGVTHDEAVGFPAHGLEIWGHAHRDYFDMAPLRGPRPRSTRWQVAMAHGHYEPPETRANPLRASWIFSDEEIAATGADYLALGHWDRPARVGNGVVPAFYSGSPELARTVNLIRLTAGVEVVVRREPLVRWD